MRGRTPVVALPLLAPTVSPEVEPMRVLGASPLPAMAWAMARPADRGHGSPGGARRRGRQPPLQRPRAAGRGGHRQAAPARASGGAENARGRPDEACRTTSPGARVGGERAAPGCCWHGLGRRHNNLTMPFFTEFLQNFYRVVMTGHATLAMLLYSGTAGEN